MAQLLTLSRAARLAGVTRGALQKKIKSGELPTFEGMVAPEELLRVYPETELEHDTEFERVSRIREEAFAKRMRERVLPDPEVLAARLTELSERLAEAGAQLEQYRTIVADLLGKLASVSEETGGTARAAIEALKHWLLEELEQGARVSQYPKALLVRDSLLRILAATVRVLPGEREFLVEGADDLLNAGLRAGLTLDYGCSDGSCGRCRARIVSGEVKQTREPACELPDQDRRAGYTLLCCNTAVTDLVIEAPEAVSVADIPGQEIRARVRAIDRPCDDMMLLGVRTPSSQRLRFMAGQSVSLELDNGLRSEYPVASCPCEERDLQFHIRRQAGDAFADYVSDGIKVQDWLVLRGPSGEFTLRNDSPNSLIFLAFDNGFAPVKSLIENAMALDSAESMHLYWVASGTGGHYLHNLCRAWADALDNFSYVPLTAAASGPDGDAVRQQVEHVINGHPDLAEFDVYIAGDDRAVDVARACLIEHGHPDGQLFGVSTD